METLWFSREADDVLDPQYLSEYKRGMEVFFSDLIRFNVDVFIVDRIVDFPFALFGDADGDIFFRTVVRNCFEICILIVFNLLIDTDSETKNLRQFANEISRNVKEEHKAEFEAHKDRMRRALDSSVGSLLEKARSIRHNIIAHWNKDIHWGQANAFNLSLIELHQLQAELNNFFQSLGFEIEHLTLPLSYDPRVSHPVGADSRPDIVRLLDSVAKESYFLREPENHPQSWEYARSRYDSRTIEKLNQYREKFGLPPA